MKRERKAIVVYLLLLSASVHHTVAQSGFVSPTAVPQTFNSGGSSFAQTQTFSSGGSFAGSQPFVNSLAVPQATPIGQTFVNNPAPLPVHHGAGFVPQTDFHAAKGYFPTMGMDGGMYMPNHVNGQYWTGQMGPYFGQGHYPATYPHPAQPWAGPGQHMYPGQYYSGYQQYQQYGFYHPQAGYSNNFGQYPHFDPNYWTGHMYPQPVYMQPMPVHFPPQQYYPGHHMPIMYAKGHYPGMPYYPVRDRGFLGGTGSGLAKGLLGALVVGVVAGSVAKKG